VTYNKEVLQKVASVGNPEYNFVLSSNQYQAAKVSTTKIYAGRYGVQILAGAIELSILQNIQTSSGTHPDSKSMKSRAFLWQ